MNNLDWIKELKVGDEVAYSCGLQDSRPRIAKIERITPTKRIVIGKGITFINGYHKIDDCTPYKLCPVTDEIREVILRKRLIFEINKFDLSLVNTDRLKQIYNMCKKEVQ